MDKPKRAPNDPRPPRPNPAPDDPQPDEKTGIRKISGRKPRTKYRLFEELSDKFIFSLLGPREPSKA